MGKTYGFHAAILPVLVVGAPSTDMRVYRASSRVTVTGTVTGGISVRTAILVMYVDFGFIVTGEPRKLQAMRDPGDDTLVMKGAYWALIAGRPESCSCAVEGSAWIQVFHNQLWLTFHFSSSSCLPVYCLSRSSRTFFSPSAFVLSCGRTSLTVLSTKTPLIIRKHFLSPDSGSKVSKTNLESVDQYMIQGRKRCR